MSRHHQRTGEALVSAGHLTTAQSRLIGLQQTALRLLGKWLPFGELVVRGRFSTRTQVAEAIHAVSGTTAEGYTALLPADLCDQLAVAPIKIDGGTLHILSACPLSSADRQRLQAACIRPVRELHIAPATRQEIRQRLVNTSSQTQSVAQLLDQLQRQDVATISGALLKRLITALYHDALTTHASDIHLFRLPDPDSLYQLRIDGEIRTRHVLSMALMAAMFNRIKTEAGMDASASNRPQDGRTQTEFQGRLLDLRVSTLPIAGGEKLVIRVLDPDTIPDLPDLLPAQPHMLALFDQLISPQGKRGALVLISGPTGSGKTTTLYAVTQRYPRESRNIITIENPVEFVLPFASQVQVNDLRGEQIGDYERAILRQDPDALVFGEIRDTASAQAALKYAESGHPVIATVHAGSAIQTMERFMSFLPPDAKDEALYVMAHYLSVVVNQVLVPRLCACAQPLPDVQQALVRQALTAQGHAVSLDARFYAPTGCPACQAGYRGRVAVMDTLAIAPDESVRAEVSATLYGQLQNFGQLSQVAGVTRWSRPFSALRLAENGIIDLASGGFAVGGLGSGL